MKDLKHYMAKLLNKIKMSFWVDIKQEEDAETLQSFLTMFKPELIVVRISFPNRFSGDKLSKLLNILSTTNKKVNKFKVEKHNIFIVSCK